MAEASKRKRTTEAKSDPTVKLHLKSQVGRDGYLQIPCNKQIKHLFIKYCKHFGLEYLALRFLYDGVLIKANKTPAELGLVDGDVIDVMGEQDGGSSMGMY